ncbi:hypothetical protein SAMN05421690_100499 [Nitrosomonas sp. Nm51]|nr:hypothetical protein SAMN05421690_100499 [Nitrosomonas sp. Nm51]
MTDLNVFFRIIVSGDVQAFAEFVDAVAIGSGLRISVCA